MKLKSDLSILTIIIDRIGQHKVLLLININYYNFKKKNTFKTNSCGRKNVESRKFPFFFFVNQRYVDKLQ